MKKTFFILFLACLELAVSCCKQDDAEYTPDGQIAFRASGAAFDVTVDTKATEVSEPSLAVSGINVSCTTGSAGSESTVWNSVAFAINAGVYKASGSPKAWPESNAYYNFYASNAAMIFDAAGTTVNATNATDVVCAYLPYGTTSSTARYKVTNTLNFEHIFARIGNVTFSAADGYTITDISVTITPKTGGTYNIRTGAGHTDATGWSNLTTGSPVSIARSTPGMQSNDLYLVPGTYVLTAGWTASQGGYTKTYSGIECEVTIVGGSVNAITANLVGEATDISVGVSVQAWGNNGINVGDFPLPINQNYIQLTGEILDEPIVNVDLTIAGTGSSFTLNNNTDIFKWRTLDILFKWCCRWENVLW